MTVFGFRDWFKMSMVGQIKLYDGSTDVKMFFKQYELTATTLDWRAEKWLSALPTFFTGLAERVYNECEDDDKRTYNDLKTYMIDKLSTTPDTYYTEFKNNKLYVGDNIKQFRLKLEELLNKAMPRLPNNEKQLILK